MLHLMVFRLVQIQVRGKGGGVPPADLNVSQATAALAAAGNKSLDACCLVSRSLASGCVRAAMVRWRPTNGDAGDAGVAGKAGDATNVFACDACAGAMMHRLWPRS